MNLLRSINIADDRARPEVIDAYRPTRKTLQVVRAVCDRERSAATHVVASYGAGKSLAALAGITLLAGDAPMAQALRDRIAPVDPDLAAATVDMAGSVLLLHGSYSDLAAALADCAGLAVDTLPKVLAEILRKARHDGIEQIAIVWDEFGQHLETLVREGRPEDLLAVQNLAEWAVRRTQPRVTLTTLMHQGVHHYIRQVSNTAQSAWKKLEGRFDTLSLLDDGADALEMLAKALNGQRMEALNGQRALKGKRDISDSTAIARARAAGFFGDIPDDARLAEILACIAPMTPAALQILPRLASQVAQAERTMFRFLAEVAAPAEPGVSVGVDALYDFFAPAMRSDTGPGGTHRRYVEAETALSRAKNDVERRIVKTSALLQLGRSAERLKLPHARLIYAVSEGSDHSPKDVKKSIQALVSGKVLLYRRRLDDVSVWHGTDLDLGKMVAEEASRLAMDNDPIKMLGHLFPPDTYTAPPYNHAHGVIRFARGQFVKADDLTSPHGLESLKLAADAEDALVALVIDATADRLDLLKIAQTLPPHLVMALPRRSTGVAPILADLMGVDALLERREILDTDPLIEGELLELKSEANAVLRQTLEQLMNPDHGDVIWVSGGTTHSFTDGLTSGEVLSRIFEERFPQTPVIVNEQIIRRRVSTVTGSARRRCMLAIIERSGLPSLGYGGSTSADASLFRAVLERTNLYTDRLGTWHWSPPSELEDLRMKRVWSKIKVFFSKSEHQPKSVEDLIDQLTSPPIGLREGVLPLLLTAGMVAFGKALALREIVDGRARYIDDVQPSVMERMCAEPRRFELEVLHLTQPQRDNLTRMIRKLVGDLDRQEPDLLRGLYDAILEWQGGLPPTALRTRGLGGSAKLLQPLLRKKPFDPVAFLFRDLPCALGEEILNDATATSFFKAVEQIEGVASAFADRAVEIASTIFNARLQGETLSLLEAAANWADFVPLDDQTVQKLDYVSRGLLARARRACNDPRSEHGFVTQLSGILCGEGFAVWDSKMADVFRFQLEEAVARIEDAVFKRADESDEFKLFLRHRLAAVFDSYRAKIGCEPLTQLIDDISRRTS